MQRGDRFKQRVSHFIGVIILVAFGEDNIVAAVDFMRLKRGY